MLKYYMKKLVAMALAAVMVLSMSPVAFATDISTDSTESDLLPPVVQQENETPDSGGPDEEISHENGGNSSDIDDGAPSNGEFTENDDGVESNLDGPAESDGLPDGKILTDVSETEVIMLAADTDPFTAALDSMRLSFPNGDINIDQAIRSGDKMMMEVVYTIHPPASESVEPGRVQFRIKVPAGVGVDMSPNANYSAAKGGKASQADADEDADFDYWWVSYQNTIAGGAYGGSFYLYITPFKDYVTANGAKRAVNIIMVDGANNAAESGNDPAPAAPAGGVPVERTQSYIAVTDKFAWNTVRAMPQSGGAKTNTNTSPAEPANMSDDPLTVTITSNSTTDASGFGHAYTGSFEFRTQFTVDVDDGGIPLLLFTAENLLAGEDGEAIESVVTKNVGDAEYVVSFVLSRTVKNETLPPSDANGEIPDANLTTASASFKIQSVDGLPVLFNTQAVVGGTTGGDNTFFINAVTDGSETANKAYPYVDTAAVTSSAGTPIAWTDAQNGTKVVEFKYTNKQPIHETGFESFTDTQYAFGKAITRIAQTPTTNTDQDSLGALPGNIVRYELGTGFVNKQQNGIDYILINDQSDPEQIKPVNFIPGEYMVGTTPLFADLEDAGALAEPFIVITYNTESDMGLTLAVTKEQVKNNTAVALPAGATEVTSIKIADGTNGIPSGFAITTGPQIEYRVLTLDEVMENQPVYNSADIGYHYNFAGEAAGTQVDVNAGTLETQAVGTGERAQSKIYFRYKLINDKVERYGFRKSIAIAQKGEGNVAGYPEAGDTMAYEAWIINDSVSVSLPIAVFTDTLSGAQAHIIDSVGLYIADADGGNEAELSDTSSPTLSGLIGEGKTIADVTAVSGNVLTINFYTDDDGTPPDESAAIPAGKRLIVKYQTTVTADFDFVNGSALSNEFVVTDEEGEVVGRGRAKWWRYSGSRFKKAYNITNELTTFQAENYVPGDIVAFEIHVRNTTDSPVTDFRVSDTYYEAGVLLPTGKFGDGLDPNAVWSGDGTSDSYQGNINRIYNLLSGATGFLGGTNGESINLLISSDAGLTGDSNISETGVAVSDIDIANGVFTIDFTGSTLAPGEEFTLLYTMSITKTTNEPPGAVLPRGGDRVVNAFETQIKTDSGYGTIDADSVALNIDAFADKKGYVHMIKSATAVAPADGTLAPSTGSLRSGDRVRYSVDIANYSTRVLKDRVIHLGTVMDTLPKYMVLDEDSVRIYPSELSLVDGIYVKTPGADLHEGTDGDYILTTTSPVGTPSDEQYALKIVFNGDQDYAGAYQLQGGYVDKNSAKYHLVIEYDCVVDTTIQFGSLGSASYYTAVNSAYSFVEESVSDLYIVSSGEFPLATPDTDNMDENAKTRSLVTTSASVRLLNDTNGKADIAKKVTDGQTLDVFAAGDLTRTYRLRLTNYTLSPLELSSVVDLLPPYEKLKGQPQITFYGSLSNPDQPGDGVTTTLDYTTGTKQETGSAYTVQTIKFTDYSYTNGLPGIDTDPGGFVLGAAKRVLTGSAGNPTETIEPYTVDIVYTTEIAGSDLNTVRAMFRDGTSNVYTFYNKAAMYPDPGLGTSAITPGSNSQRVYENDGDADNNWDQDDTTTYRFTVTAPVALMDDSTAPYVGITPMTLSSTMETSPYDENSKIMPGDYVAFDIHAGNAKVNMVGGTAFSVKTIEAGSNLVVELPPRLSYHGVQALSGKDDPLPDLLGGEPDVRTRDGRTYLVWTVAEELPAGTDIPFTLIAGTGGDYTSYSVSAYFVPPQKPEQFFYSQVLQASAESALYGFTEAILNMTDAGKGFTANDHLVMAQTGILVFGNLGISVGMSVAEDLNPSNMKETANHKDRILTLDQPAATDGSLDAADGLTRNSRFTYTMNFNVASQSDGFGSPVFINRLPSVGDSMVRAGSRGSAAYARLIGDDPDNPGNVAVAVATTVNHVADPAFDPDNWMIEYFTGTADEAFSEDDWAGKASTRWLAANEVTDVSKVTAIRIRQTDESRDSEQNGGAGTTGYYIPSGYTMKISATAQLYEYYEPLKVGLDSFAFSGHIGKGATPVSVGGESLTLGVQTNLPYDRAAVTKILLDDAETPRFTGPYEVQLNLDGQAVSDPAKLVVSKMQASGHWISETEIFNDLERGKAVSVTELNNPSGYKPYVVSVNPVSGPAGSVFYDIKVTNEPYKYRVYYHPNGGTGAQNDEAAYYQNDSINVLDRGSMQRPSAIFTGWNTKPEGDGQGYSEGQADAFHITADTVLYAQWLPVDEGNPNPPTTPPTTIRPTPPGPEPPSAEEPPGQSESPGGGGSLEPAPPVPAPEPEPVPPENWLQALLNGDVPLGGLNVTDSWSLLSAILSLIALLAAIALTIAAVVRLGRRKEDEEEESDNETSNIEKVRDENGEEEEEEEEKRRQRTTIWTILAIIAGVLVIVVWLILDWPLVNMVWINHWTPIVIIIFVIHLVLMIIHKTRREKREEDEEDGEKEEEA